MDLVLRKLFSEHSRILFVALRSINYLESRSGYATKLKFSSNSLLSRNSTVLQSDTDQKNYSRKEDPFQLLVNNRLLEKKLPKNTAFDISIKLPPQQAAVREKHLAGNYFYGEFIKSSDSENLNRIATSLSENVHLLSSEQLIKTVEHLQTLPREDSSSSKQLILLIGQVDRECCKRSSKWNKDMCLQAALSFIRLKFSNVFLLQKVVVQLAGEICHMTPQELVSYLSIVKQFRKFPDEIEKKQLETRIYQVINSLSIEDLGIISLAFFECQLGIQNVVLVASMAERLLESANLTDEKTVGSMLKLFRKSSTDTARYAKEILELQPKLCNQISQWGPKVLMQLVSVGSNLLYFHAPTIERVLEKFLSCLNEARLKDVERLAMVVAISCHQSPNSHRFWSALENEFTREERRQEISQYPNAFISLVNYAVVANQFKEKLLHMVLHPDFVKCAKAFSEKSSYSSTKRELLSLDCSVNIENPEYNGPRLTSKDVQAFQNLYRKPIPNLEGRQKLSNHDVFLLALLDTTQEYIGKENDSALVYLQPHFPAPDIVFCLNNRRKENSRSLINDCNVQRCALVGGSRNMYSKYTNQPMGPLRMKIRQLQLMGYRVIPIPWYEFLPLSQSDRKCFLSQKICAEISDKSGSTNQ